MWGEIQSYCKERTDVSPKISIYIQKAVFVWLGFESWALNLVTVMEFTGCR